MSDLTTLTIAEARDALARGETSSVELTDACLTAIEGAGIRPGPCGWQHDHRHLRERLVQLGLQEGLHILERWLDNSPCARAFASVEACGAAVCCRAANHTIATSGRGVVGASGVGHRWLVALAGRAAAALIVQQEQEVCSSAV